MTAAALPVYKPLLKQAAQLMPEGVKVVLLADRGFCDTKLMAYLKDELFWHYRLRIKASLGCYLAQGTSIKLSCVSLALGEARFWQAVSLTAKRYGPVSIALGRPYGS